MLVLLTGSLVSARHYLFYKKIEECFEGQGKYRITFNSRKSGLKKVNISLRPSFLAKTTFSKFFGGAIGSVKQIWLISPSLESQRLVSTFPKLDGLGIRDNTTISSDSFERIGRKPLKILHLTSTSINDKQFRYLTSGGKIEDLFIADEKNLTAQGLIAIADQKHLRWASLAGLPQLTNLEWQKLASNLNSIEHLHVSGSAVDDTVIQHIPTSGNLITITLLDTSITDSGIEALVKHRGLEGIVIRNGSISFSGIKLFHNLPMLRELVISGPLLSPQEVDELHRLMPNVELKYFNPLSRAGQQK